MIEGAADHLKPEKDAAGWCVTGFGRFAFSSEKDAEAAIELAKAVERSHRSVIATAIAKLIGY